jgi:outer membrane receptor protein involved in Fe transport
MTNAGRTRSFGCEIAATAKPTDRIRLNASWGHTNARFTKYHNGIADMAGRRLPYAPANTLFLAASYTLPLSSSQLSFSASLRGTGRIYWDDSNTVSQPFYILPSAYAEWSNSRVSIKLWGENISNTKYNTFYFVSIGNAFVQKGNPWTAGLTLRINIHISTTK